MIEERALKKDKKIGSILVAIAIVLIMVSFSYLIISLNTNKQEPVQPPAKAIWTISVNNGTYFAVSPERYVTYYDRNASMVVEYMADQLNQTGGGIVYFERGGYFVFNTPIDFGVNTAVYLYNVTIIYSGSTPDYNSTWGR